MGWQKVAGYILSSFIVSSAWGLPPVCLKKILEAIGTSQAAITRTHPDALDINSLKVGEEIAIAPEAFAGKAGGNEIQSPIFGTIKEILPIEFSSAEGKVSTTLVTVKQQNGDSISIEQEHLRGNIYSDKNYLMHSPFKEGEYVRIGNEGRSTRVSVASRSEKTYETQTEFPAKFLKVVDPGHYLVEKQINHTGKVAQFKVPKESVGGTTTGSLARVLDATKPTHEIQLDFLPNERVRYRTSNGQMQVGHLSSRGLLNGIAEVDNETTHTRSIIPQSKLFKLPPDAHNPGTKYFKMMDVTQMNRPEEAVVTMFDGAARITSHPDYAASTAQEKLQILTRYVERFVPWSAAGKVAEKHGLANYNQLICSGVGVCRHNTVILATILEESGYPVRFVHHHISKKIGHAWLEADMKLADGTTQTYVVDPSHRLGTDIFVKSLTDVKKDAHENPLSSSAVYYTQTNRHFLYPDSATPSPKK